MAAGAGGVNLNNDKLDTAVQDGNIHDVIMLLNAGADPNYIGESGVTMMNYAVSNQKPAIVKLLLEKGAHVHLPNDEDKGVTHEDRGFTPLETVFIRRYDNGDNLDPNIAKHILFILIYYGNALSEISPAEIAARFPPDQIAWLNTTYQEIREWISDAAANRRGPAVAAMMRSAGLLGGKRRKTLRGKRIHKKRKTQRRLRRVRR